MSDALDLAIGSRLAWRRRAEEMEAECERLRSQLVNARQHVGWLRQYHLGMTESNWRDMKLQAERQIDELSALFDDARNRSKQVIDGAHDFAKRLRGETAQIDDQRSEK